MNLKDVFPVSTVIHQPVGHLGSSGITVDMGKIAKVNLDKINAELKGKGIPEVSEQDIINALVEDFRKQYPNYKYP